MMRAVSLVAVAILFFSQASPTNAFAQTRQGCTSSTLASEVQAFDAQIRVWVKAAGGMPKDVSSDRAASAAAITNFRSETAKTSVFGTDPVFTACFSGTSNRDTQSVFKAKIDALESSTDALLQALAPGSTSSQADIAALTQPIHHDAVDAARAAGVLSREASAFRPSGATGAQSTSSDENVPAQPDAADMPTPPDLGFVPTGRECRVNTSGQSGLIFGKPPYMPLRFGILPPELAHGLPPSSVDKQPLSEGTARLKGRVQAHGPTGDVPLQANVFVFRATPYTRDYIRRLYKAFTTYRQYCTPWPQIDKTVFANARHLEADDGGYWVARDLPAGSYYVVCVGDYYVTGQDDGNGGMYTNTWHLSLYQTPDPIVAVTAKTTEVERDDEEQSTITCGLGILAKDCQYGIHFKPWW